MCWTTFVYGYCLMTLRGERKTLARRVITPSVVALFFMPESFVKGLDLIEV